MSSSGVRIELEGGHVFEYRRAEPHDDEHPSLPPAAPVRVVETTAEPVSGPGLRKCAEVIPFRRRVAS